MSTINFSGTPTTLNLGESTELVAEVNGIGSSLFSWLSNGNPIGEGNPLTYTPTEVGVEDITLEVKVPSNVSDGSVGSCPIGESYYFADTSSTTPFSSDDWAGDAVIDGNGLTVSNGYTALYKLQYWQLTSKTVGEVVTYISSGSFITYDFIQSNGGGHRLKFWIDNRGVFVADDLSTDNVEAVDYANNSYYFRLRITANLDGSSKFEYWVHLQSDDSLVSSKTVDRPIGSWDTTQAYGYFLSSYQSTQTYKSLYIVGTGLPNQCQGMWETFGTLTKPAYLNISEETITNLFERVRNMEFKIPNTKEVSLNGENVSCTANTFQQLKPKYAKEYCGDNATMLLTEQAVIKDINGDEINLATLPAGEAQEYLNKVFAFLARFNV